MMKGLKRFTQTGLVPSYMASRMKKKDRQGLCPYESIHSLALLYAYTCSNQCEHRYSDSWLWKHVDGNIVESRIESSSEKDQNKLEIWKKDKQCHMSECHFMKIWLNIEMWRNLKKMVFIGMFHLYFMHQLL